MRSQMGLSPRVRGTFRMWGLSRVCRSRGTRCRCDYGHDWHGLSPRVRGNPDRGIGQQQQRRSIPACAGEPVLARPVCLVDQVYPRVCGGTRCRTGVNDQGEGLSPRVRGNQSGSDRISDSQRSIPACAGEPRSASDFFGLPWVYPRVCGGTSPTRRQTYCPDGLSPRVRGNPMVMGQNCVKQWSIPACAGEPWPFPERWYRPQVYPRVCGGTRLYLKRVQACGGLSPRVRGNQRHSPKRQRRRRSIPACAGEPSLHVSHESPLWVYPRVCGGTPHRVHNPTSSLGLSPRVRGNRCPPDAIGRCFWSIPACAGNPIGLCRVGYWPRSIPACAGEPAAAAAVNAPTRVYPRVCGGTMSKITPPSCATGLSPRVRGNLRDDRSNGARWGSIPACAGEPQTASFAGDEKPRRVYPRVCGGTAVVAPPITAAQGLSPRVRGNRPQ